MRLTSAVKRRPPQVVAQGVPLPPPTGGWDAISPLANMPVDRAVTLDNWVPRPGWIEPRNGFVAHSTGMSGNPVQTVMAYNAFTGGIKLFGVAGSAIYDCTAHGTASLTGATVSNSRLQYIQFSNPSSVQYLIAVNGVDVPWQYDGTSWTHPSYTGTGVVPTSFIQVATHQGRLWFVQANSTNPVYLTTPGAVTGAAAVFQLGQFLDKGGYIVAIGTWTVDTRQNVDEYIAFISSRGQVLVYAGTDPSTVNTWSLVGKYQIGHPIGTRCFSRIAGDLLIITIDGVVGMSEMLSTDRAAANRVSLTSKIMNQMAISAQQYGTNFGWQIIEYPKGTLSILNIPTAEDRNSIQYVMNTITGAWCQFKGINALAWEIDAADNIYFGGPDGVLYQWNVGSSDNGVPIVCLVETAYNAFGNAAQRKRYTALQPLITTTGNPIPSTGINIDFVDSLNLSTAQPFVDTTNVWDSVSWDSFFWAGTAQVTNDWISVVGTGHYVSVVTQITTVQDPSSPTSTVSFQLNGWNITAESGAYI